MPGVRNGYLLPLQFLGITSFQTCLLSQKNKTRSYGSGWLKNSHDIHTEKKKKKKAVDLGLNVDWRIVYLL